MSIGVPGLFLKAYPTHSSLSQEVTSKVAVADEEVGEGVKTLSEKLSAALLNISAKEELVKQHAKVAEEAVSGSATKIDVSYNETPSICIREKLVWFLHIFNATLKKEASFPPVFLVSV